MKKCVTKKCRNQALKHRSICAACKSKKYREANRIKAAYDSLKHNAKRRGKIFELTFEEFKQFTKKTDYFKKVGTKSESYHIDRIDETKGYTIDNIQVLTNAQNVRKFLKYYYDERAKRMVFSTQTFKPAVQEGCPF